MEKCVDKERETMDRSGAAVGRRLLRRAFEANQHLGIVFAKRVREDVGNVRLAPQASIQSSRGAGGNERERDGTSGEDAFCARCKRQARRRAPREIAHKNSRHLLPLPLTRRAMGSIFPNFTSS